MAGRNAPLLLVIRRIFLLVSLPILVQAGEERHLELAPKVCDMNGLCTPRNFTLLPTGNKEDEISEVFFEVELKIDSLRADYNGVVQRAFEKALCEYQDWGIDMFCGMDENINFKNCSITAVQPSDDPVTGRTEDDASSPYSFDRRFYTIKYDTRGECGEFCPQNALAGQSSIDSQSGRSLDMNMANMMQNNSNNMMAGMMNMMPRACLRLLIDFLNEANLTDSTFLEVTKDKLVEDKCETIFACDIPECSCPNPSNTKEKTTSGATAISFCFRMLMALLSMLFLIA